MTDAAAAAAAAHVARTSYGRLVSLLAASTRDVALAEDALQGALEEALRRWPVAGVPDRPEAWIMTVARNRQRDVLGSAARRVVPLDVEPAVDPLAAIDLDAIGDRRLELLFASAHPAIDASMHAPLMLQTVLGFEAAAVATAFGVAPQTMAQRLVRAKRRIRDARIPFRIPDRRVMPQRLPPVLEAIYGCTALSWRDDPGSSGPSSMAGEARHMAVTLATLLGTEREAWALAALVTLSLARRTPSFVPLDERDAAAWDAALLADGRAMLAQAQGDGPPGRFELEAAIQAVHCARRETGATDWASLETLYDALLVVAPTAGARIARAAVVGRRHGADAGLAALGAVQPLQAWWAVRARLLADAGRAEQARDAWLHAASLATDDDVRDHLVALAARG